MPADFDRVKASLVALVRSVFPTVDYMALYSCAVVGQNADNSLELQPDDERIPGLSNVPIRSVAGIAVKVSAGSRVAIGFENGDPGKPVALFFEASSVATELTITAASIVFNSGVLPVARAGDTAGPYPIVGGNATVKA